MKEKKKQKKIIHGIQQVGVGVSNMHVAWKWYREHFGMDIKIFEDASTAELMLPYTGGEPRERHAVLIFNLGGGAGFEVWQYTERKPEAPSFELKLGDLGIFATRIKTRNVQAAYEFLQSRQVNLLSEIQEDPSEKEHFFLKDPYNNIFQVAKSTNYFREEKHYTGGPAGVMIGVSDMEKSIKFYTDLLGYNEAVYEKEGVFEDFACLLNGDQKYRRVLLKHGSPRAGGFARMLGTTKIELVQALERKPEKIYKNRFWGDLGFIHLCFDISNMDALKEECDELGYPFTVDSRNSFDMGEAAGHFSYVEDPDGTLIEFVETHKVPIFKKIGWYLDLNKRDRSKNLPDWLLNSLRFGRIRK